MFSNVALIWAAVPVIVTLFVPLLVTTAPPAAVTFKVPPLFTDKTVEATCVGSPTSKSVTLMPEIARDVSSFTLCAPGTVFTGASSTGVTSIVTVSLSVSGVPEVSVESTVKVSAPL